MTKVKGLAESGRLCGRPFLFMIVCFDANDVFRYTVHFRTSVNFIDHLYEKMDDQ